MNYDKLLESVKKHEGFRDTVYLDTLNKRTVGFGHLCVEDHWEDGKKYDKEYFSDDNPSVSDHEYDKVKKEVINTNELMLGE